MLNHREVNLSGDPQGLAHDVLTQNGPAVVSNSHSACTLQAAKVGKRRTLAGMGRGRHWENVDHRAALWLLRPRDPFGRIQNWVRVWHAADRSESTSRGGGGAGGDGFFVGLPRLAQVNVQINKAGSNDQATSIEFLVGASTNFIRRRDFRDATVAQ